MRSIYEHTKIPLQVRRLLIFMAICRKAKSTPNKMVHLSYVGKLAFGVIYIQGNKRYIAYGSVFEYAHTRKEVIEQGVDKLPHEESVMCAITIKRQAFTKPARTPLALLKQWNKYLKNRPCNYLDRNIQSFFPVNDELEMDYPPHHFHNRLVAIEGVPLWENVKSFITPAYIDDKGRFRATGYLEKRLV